MPPPSGRTATVSSGRPYGSGMTQRTPRTCSGIGCWEQATAFYDHLGSHDVLGLCATHDAMWEAREVIEIRADEAPSGEQEYLVQFG